MNEYIANLELLIVLLWILVGLLGFKVLVEIIEFFKEK